MLRTFPSCRVREGLSSDIQAAGPAPRPSLCRDLFPLNTERGAGGPASAPGRHALWALSLQAQEYLFKYIVQSRRLFSLATGGQNEEEFRRCIQELLLSVRFFLSQESKGSGALSQSQVIPPSLLGVRAVSPAVCLSGLREGVCSRGMQGPVRICSLAGWEQPQPASPGVWEPTEQTAGRVPSDRPF